MPLLWRVGTAVRKVLSDIAIREPEAFRAIAATAQAALEKAPPPAAAA